MRNRASEVHGLDRLSDALHYFKCCKDADIELFLRDKALNFIDRGWCSVYLILDEDAFDAGKLQIDAYFTLSHKSLIAANISKNKVQQITGFKHTDALHFVLIGQLGKYIEKNDDDSMQAANISSAEILDYAFEIIRSSSNLIPCRCVLVECSDDPKVQKVYLNYGFSYFQHDDDHHQFYKKL